MPELTVLHIALMATTAVIGAIIGWVLRGNRSEQEKAAVSAGWQGQIDAQRREGDRLLVQNKGLMEQVSQFQASHTDAKNRAKELSGAVQEAFARRDELQREIKDIRSNLEVAVSERDRLQSDLVDRDSDIDIVQQKDARIEKLKKELENWQNRVPPLIERFRARNEEATQLETQLQHAHLRIHELESAAQKEFPEDQTRIEPVTNPDELTDGLDASNDPVDDYDDDSDDETDLDDDDLDDDDLDDLDDDDDDDEDEDLEGDDDLGDEPESGAVSRRDDLKCIKGIGPAIEKTLHEMGIFSFQQIADMSEYDIDRVARRLKGFRSRIYREDWIGQARELRDQTMNA